MKGITVLFDMVTEFETHAGYLVDESHAIFKDGKWITMVKVEKTESPNVYRQCGGSMNLGEYAGTDIVPKIIDLVVRMKSRTAYDLLTELVDNDEFLEMTVF
jgi:hypothetical protein